MFNPRLPITHYPFLTKSGNAVVMGSQTLSPATSHTTLRKASHSPFSTAKHPGALSDAKPAHAVSHAPWARSPKLQLPQAAAQWQRLQGLRSPGV
jgi:hypothetical protein